MRIAYLLPIVALPLLSSGCLIGQFMARNVASLGEMKSVPNKITDPSRPDARLAVLWVGHATVLIQMDDKFILTDPVFTSTVGQLSPRLVEQGIEVGHLQIGRAHV